MALDRILGMALRIGQLVFAAVVAGLTGDHLHNTRNQRKRDRKRFIYTEVIAAISIVLALLWLLPFTAAFIHWPVDLLLFVAWIVAFGLLVDFIGPLNCGSVFNWGGITNKGTCNRWKADVAFTFLSAIFWLASALLGLYFIRKHRRAGRPVAGDGVAAPNATRARGKWYRRR